VLDKEKCSVWDYMDAMVLHRMSVELRSTTRKTERGDLPPIIDKTRKMHGKFQALKPPEDCEIFVVLHYHIEAEMDQTIRGLIAYRSFDEEAMEDYLSEMLFHKETAQGLLERIPGY